MSPTIRTPIRGLRNVTVTALRKHDGADIELDVEKARHFLAQSRDLDEVRKVRDKSEAVARYLRARAAGDDSAVHAAAIARCAERRLGELVKELPKAKAPPGPGRGKKGGSSVRPPLSTAPTLADHGITKSESSRWQAVASVPEKKFQTEIDTAIERKRPPTTASFVRIAKEMRDGKKEPPPFHALVALAELKDRLVAAISTNTERWPVRARLNVPGMLRDLADDMEREFSC